MSIYSNVRTLAAEAVKSYSNSVPSRSAAALAYRGVFSLAPLILICVLITSLFVGQETATEEIGEMVDAVLDEESAEVVEQSVEVMFWTTEREFTLTSIIGLGILLYGASALFTEIRYALHSVWGLPPVPQKGWMTVFLSQVVSILMVFIIGLLCLSLILLNVFVAHLESEVFSSYWISLEWISYLGSVVILTILVGILFRLVPSVSLPWSDIWIGSVATSILLMLGVRAIGVYFTYGDVGSTAGAAGAFIVVLLGSYFAAHIFLFGASLAYAYSVNFGTGGPEAFQQDADIAEGGR